MKGFKLKINKQKFVSDEKCISGRTILQMVGITDVTQFGLYQKIKGKTMERIKDLDAHIDLSKKGIERFVSLPLEQQEGEATQMVKLLPECDQAFLKDLALKWDLVPEGGIHWLVIYDFPIPEGYNFGTSDVSLRLERCYPDTQIDMVYFGHQLALNSGTTIRQIVSVNHLNRTWQRWSRHRTSQNPWRPGIDCIETHIVQVRHWLEREIR